MSLGGARIWRVCFIYTKIMGFLISRIYSWFSVYLGSSPDFISMIFGIYGKFHVDICENILKIKQFSMPKKSQKVQKLVFKEHFENFRNSIGIWRTPFINSIKGVLQIPIEFWKFSLKHIFSNCLGFFFASKIDLF